MKTIAELVSEIRRYRGALRGFPNDDDLHHMCSDLAEDLCNALEREDSEARARLKSEIDGRARDRKNAEWTREHIQGRLDYVLSRLRGILEPVTIILGNVSIREEVNLDMTSKDARPEALQTAMYIGRGDDESERLRARSALDAEDLVPGMTPIVYRVTDATDLVRWTFNYRYLYARRLSKLYELLDLIEGVPDGANHQSG